jgi:hypothetical protein
MAYVAMFATISPFLVMYDNTTKASINLQILTELEPLRLAWMLSVIQTPPRPNFPLFDLMFTFSPFGPLWYHILETTCKLKPQACFGITFSPFGIKSPKSPKQKGVQEN